MSRNGERKPPRPQIELVTPAASPEEAAAVVAAIERFVADTTPPPPSPSNRMSRWQRAALREGAGAGTGPSPWDETLPWGAR